MRTCTACKEPKSLSEFYKKGRGYHSWCKPCILAYSKEHYEKNRAERLKQNRQYKLASRQRVWDLKDNQPCADCGKKYPHYIMEFDHVRGKKISDVSQMYWSPDDGKKVLKEIAKCDLVCANCHRERTWARNH
jgi:hypothetical protein